MTSVLIAEDTTRPVSPLERDLRANGYTTTSARDDNQMLALANDARVDLVILDLEPSDIRGPFTLQALRAAGATMPVIVLDPSGRASAALMLESGADDFMAKPYRFEELLARMRARLRPTPPPAHETLTIGDLSLDPLTRRCTIEDRVVELTTREFDLAEALLRHPNQVLTRDQLLTQIWGPGLDAGSNVIDVYVGYLRRKLGADIIHTVRGMGYRLAS